MFESNYVSRCARGQCMHTTLEGGDEQSASRVFLLSIAPSKRPHFVVVSYGTTTFVPATLAMFTNGMKAKCHLC